MFSKNHTPKIILISILSILVSSCGGGDGNTPQPPPVVPKAIVSGNVIIGPVENASVTIYEIKNNIPENSSVPVFTRARLKDLGSNVTDADGFYSIELQIDKPVTPILVCSTGGQYYEPASPADSPKLKTIGTDQELCSVALFKRGKNMSVHITPFSHLAYSFAKSKIESGEALIDTIIPATETSGERIELGAITLANKSISDWLQLQDKEKINQGVISVKPLSISDSNSNKGSIFRAGNKYGFALAAISDLVELLRLDAGGKAGEEFVGVSSFEYAQRLFEDMQDGFLNAKVNSGPFLRVGGNDLSLHIIRHHFALKIFAVTANTSVNKTGFTIGQVKDFVTAVNVNASPDLPAHSNANGASTIARNNHGVLFDGDPEELIDNTDITISHIFPKDNYIMKDIENIRVEAFDISGIQSIGLTIMPAGKKIGAVPPARPRNLAADPLIPSWRIDTNAASPEGLPDGSYDLVFDALSNAGKLKSQTVYSVNVSNSGVSAIINNPRVRGDGDANAIALNPDYAINSIVNFKATVTDKFFYDTVTDPSNRNQPISDFIKFTINDPNNADLPIINIPLETGTNPPPFSKPNSTTRIYNAGTVLEPLTNGAQFLDTNGDLIEGKYQLEVYAMSGLAPVPADPKTGQAPVDPVYVKKTVNFALDKTPPVASIGIGSQAFPGDVLIVGTFSDPNSDPASTVYGSGLLSAAITENSSVLTDFPLVPSTNKISRQVTFNLGRQGWHNIKLKVTDIAGNSFETPKIVEIGYDKIPPSVTISRTLGGNNVKNRWWNVLNLETLIKDEAPGTLGTGTGIASLKAGFDGQLTTVTTSANFTLDPRALSFKYPEPVIPNSISVTKDGVHSYSVEAKDHAGHVTTDKLIGIGIDTTAPTVNINMSQNKYFRDVTTQQATKINSQSLTNYLTIDMVNQTAILYVNKNFTVQETGYSYSGGVDLVGSDSGIKEVVVGSQPPFLPPTNQINYISINAQTNHTVVNIPRLVITSTATRKEAWEVTAYCPDPTVGNTMTVSAGVCVETGVGNKITKFRWVLQSSIYINASDSSNYGLLTDNTLPLNWNSNPSKLSIESTFPVVVKASDLAIPTPNIADPYYCVSITAFNESTNTLPTAARSAALIGGDVLPAALSPAPVPATPTVNGTNPTTYLSNVSAVGCKALTPMLSSSATPIAVNSTICTLTGIPKSIENSTLTPSAAVQKSSIRIVRAVYGPVNLNAKPQRPCP